jgi:transmembrane sensor
MSERAEPARFDNPAADAAATWFARQRSGPWSEAQAAQFAAWLKAEPAHSKAWMEYESLWGRFEAVRNDPRVLAIRENARRRTRRRELLRGGWGMGGAIAAALLAATFASWVIKGSLLPHYREATLTQGPVEKPPESSLVRIVDTGVGERSLLVLPDGSRVTLNTASAVRTDYSGRERRVTLVRGQAFFDVAKDPSRPFVVVAGSREVIAVGTAFDVRLTGQQVKVTLVEGKVRVVAVPRDIAASSGAVSAINLEAGSMLTARNDGVDHVDHLDTARATSWRTGKLVFDGERLADVVAEMNRYSREQLVIGDQALEDRKVSGVFDSTGGRAVARALEAYGLARASEQSADIIVLTSP